MSRQAVCEFLSKLEANKALQDRLSGDVREAMRAAVVQFAEGLGCTFTVEDLVEEVAARSGELSDQELEDAAGGVSTSPPPTSLGALRKIVLGGGGPGIHGDPH
jgi:predicted ribosomally synthesized peptide with nif11-like leader